MNQEMIIRAWKDEEYRSTLGAAELAALPENPAGIVEIPDDSLGAVNGAEDAGSTTLIFYLLTVACSCVAGMCEDSTYQRATCAMRTAGCCGEGEYGGGGDIAE